MTRSPEEVGRPAEDLRIAGLSVHRWAGGPKTVVGLAGLGNSWPTWMHLAQSLPDWTVVAPDVRGRGGSVDVKGPAGLRHHARDISQVLEALDLSDVVVVGHSMGAFLAPVLADEARGRVAKLVMVDGGIPPSLPWFYRPALVRVLFRRQLANTARVWPDLESFAANSKLDSMVASQPGLREEILEMFWLELGGGNGPLRLRVDADHAAGDAVDTFFGPDVALGLDGLTVPADALLATSMRKDGEKPFITDKAAVLWSARQPRLRVVRLAGNHLTVLFDPQVSASVSS